MLGYERYGRQIGAGLQDNSIRVSKSTVCYERVAIFIDFHSVVTKTKLLAKLDVAKIPSNIRVQGVAPWP